MKRVTGLLVAAIIGAGVTACGSGSPTSNSTKPTPRSKSTAFGGVHMAENPFAADDSWIAHHGYDPDHIWLGLVHPDGSGARRIETGLPGDNILPNWHPDGTRLAFGTRGGETEALYEYDMNTGTTRQLFACKRPCLGDANPVYSPSGERIAFIRYLGPLVNDVPSDCGIWVGDLETGRVRQLTSHTNPPCDPYESVIRWSPDGKRLAYHRDIPLPSKKATTAIYSMAPDGTDERRLTEPDLVAGEPAYSPDGKWIVFCTNTLESDVERHDSQLYRMRPDGTGVEQLTDFEDVRATQPSYSPDGDWIIFSAVVTGAIDLWAIPAAGGAPVVVSDLDTARTHGTWQPSPRT